jgi:hypothetical protein
MPPVETEYTDRIDIESLAGISLVICLYFHFAILLTHTRFLEFRASELLEVFISCTIWPIC